MIPNRVNPDRRKRVVILDRDGTIVIDRGYLDDPAGLAFLPGAAEGLRYLHERGFRLVVITNQSGIGRGRLSAERLHEIHERFIDMVRSAGAYIEAIYYCPHSPETGCACRKPGSALLLQAAAELGFDSRQAIVIGDKQSDIELGRRVSATTIFIRGDSTGDSLSANADFVVDDLLQAAHIIADTSVQHAH
ncbi:MAG: histidinol-phosphate phosphatase family protein [Gammaproteobacteria bacterium]|nr:histidinol-phosphate phosphatase family protein [Gammaproteobacteria bacterium]